MNVGIMSELCRNKQTEEFMLNNMRTPAKVVGFKTEFRTEYYAKKGLNE